MLIYKINIYIFKNNNSWMLIKIKKQTLKNL